MPERNLPPTRRRLERARIEGEAVDTGALGAATALLAAVLVVPSLLRVLAREATRWIERAVTEPPADFDAGEAIGSVLVASLPLVAACAVLSFAVRWIANGGIFSFRAVAPRLGRLAPVGARSGAPWFDGLRVALGGGLVLWIALSLLRTNAGGLADTAGSLEDAMVGAGRVAERLALAAIGAFAVLAIIDLVVKRASFFAGMRMTRTELEREKRETEAAPEMREARRRAYAAMAFGTNLTLLENARVVVTDGTRSAIAIAYDKTRDRAPSVGTIARGEAVFPLLSLAHQRAIPVVDEPALVRAILESGTGEASAVPARLYDDLAHVFALAAPGDGAPTG